MGMERRRAFVRATPDAVAHRARKDTWENLGMLAIFLGPWAHGGPWPTWPHMAPHMPHGDSHLFRKQLGLVQRPVSPLKGLGRGKVGEGWAWTPPPEGGGKQQQYCHA